MFNIKDKKFIQDNCTKRPYFNLSNETKALYCFEHKSENMVDIISKKCIHTNCIKRPNFNLPTENIGLYCSNNL